MQDEESASRAFRPSISSSMQVRSDASHTGRLKKASDRSEPTRDTTTLDRNETLSSQLMESGRLKLAYLRYMNQESNTAGATTAKNAESPSRKRYFSIIENQARTNPATPQGRKVNINEEDTALRPMGSPNDQDLDNQEENMQMPPNRNISHTFDESRRRIAPVAGKTLAGRMGRKSMGPQTDFDSESEVDGRTGSGPHSRLVYSNATSEQLSQTLQHKLSNGMPKPEYLETLESVMDNYRKPKLLRVNHRNEIRDMVQKASRKIVVRSFSKRSFDDSQTAQPEHANSSRFLNRPGRPSLLIEVDKRRADIVDSSKDSPEQRNSLRVYQGHDSPIRVKPSSSKFKISINGEDNEGYMDQIDRLATPYIKETPSSKRFKAISRGSVQKDQPPPKSPALSATAHPHIQDGLPGRKFSEIAQEVEAALGSNESNLHKDKSLPNSRRNAGGAVTKERPKSYVDFGKITIDPYKDEALSRAENVSQDSRSVMSEDDYAPRFGRNLPEATKATGESVDEATQAGKKASLRAKSHLTAIEAKLSKPLEISAANVASTNDQRAREKEKEREKERDKEKQLATKQAGSSFPVHVIDVTAPNFDLNRFQFLLFAQQPPNKKAFKIFLKEIKQDLDLVKSISFKEPMVRKVIFTNVDPSRTFLIQANASCSWTWTRL